MVFIYLFFTFLPEKALFQDADFEEAPRVSRSQPTLCVCLISLSSVFTCCLAVFTSTLSTVNTRNHSYHFFPPLCSDVSNRFGCLPRVRLQNKTRCSHCECQRWHRVWNHNETPPPAAPRPTAKEAFPHFIFMRLILSAPPEEAPEQPGISSAAGRLSPHPAPPRLPSLPPRAWGARSALYKQHRRSEPVAAVTDHKSWDTWGHCDCSFYSTHVASRRARRLGPPRDWIDFKGL